MTAKSHTAETMRHYTGRCPNCNRLLAIHRGDTAEEQISAAPDLKRWIKRGLKVELETFAVDAPTPDWCRCNRKDKK